MDKMGSGASGADFLAALRYARNSAQDFVTGTGANRDVPVTQPGPALAAVNAMPLPGQSGSIINPRGSGGNLGEQAAAATATTNQQIDRLTQPPVTPAFTPQPVAPPPAGSGAVPSPVPATVAPYNPAAVNQAPVFTPRPPTTVLPVPGSGVDPNTAPGVLPGMPGAPSVIPGAPTNQMPVNVPYPDNAGAQSVMPQQAPGFLSAMRPGSQQYDPTPSAMQMIADPNWDNEAVRRAYFELYGRELQIA